MFYYNICICDLKLFWIVARDIGIQLDFYFMWTITFFEQSFAAKKDYWKISNN